jgi:hypothetical protein
MALAAFAKDEVTKYQVTKYQVTKYQVAKDYVPWRCRIWSAMGGRMARIARRPAMPVGATCRCGDSAVALACR